MYRRIHSSLFLLFACALKAQSLDSKTIFPSDSRAFVHTEDKDLIQTGCPGRAERGGTVDCGKNCPSSSGLDGGQHIFDWSLKRVTRGHFLSATSDDAVIATDGCEPHSENFGGSILLTRRSGRWRVLWYKSGVQTERCHRVELKGHREILVCQGQYSGQGNVWTLLYAEDLLHPLGSLMAAPPHIFAIFDNSLACGFYDEAHTLKHALLERVDFANAQGADQTMSVTFSQGARLVTPEATDACTDHPKSFMPPMRHYPIDFTFDGQKFEPTPSSAELVKRLGLK